MSALDRILNQTEHSLWRDDHANLCHKEISHADSQSWSFACHSGSPTGIEAPNANSSFQPHSHNSDLGLGDTIEKLLSDGCCSSENSENDDSRKVDSPLPMDVIPNFDWSGVRSEPESSAAMMDGAGGQYPSPNDAIAGETCDGIVEHSPTSITSPLQDSDAASANRRRYVRSYWPRYDLHQQRATIDAELARKREDHNAMMAQRQQLSLQQMGVAAKILCNEAHRRHVAQVGKRGAEASSFKATGNASTGTAEYTGTPTKAVGTYTASTTGCSPVVREDDFSCVSAAWRNVADCVEESLFHPGAVQARLSCMGIFRNDIKLGDLICYDDHEEERIAIRARQQQIMDVLRCQTMAGQNSFFLEKPFDFTGATRADPWTNVDLESRCDEEDPYSPTSFIPMGDW